MKVLVSGVQSGPNPGPGLGLARSVRAAFPEAEIIGLDYGQNASTRFFGTFDDVLSLDSWSALDLDRHADDLRAELARGAALLPGLDLQIRWLQEALPDQDGIFAPPRSSRDWYRKPCRSVASCMAFETPSVVTTDEGDRALSSFARHLGWRVWLKGPWYDAYRVWSWPDLENRRRWLESVWGDEEALLLQEDVAGTECSISFVAVAGALIDAVAMRKLAQTDSGKTWTGAVDDLSPEDWSGLARFVVESRWHGGGEIEFIATEAGDRFIIECNPRFPAWIYGAALCGRNLVASGLSGRAIRDGATGAGLFSRVVTEVPFEER